MADTSVNVTFVITTGGKVFVALFNMSWGTSSGSYPNKAVNEAVVGNSTPGYAFINYLEPSTTYYYQVTAWSFCEASGVYHNYHSWYNSSGTTDTDSHGYISGQVVDQNGSLPPSEGLPVWITCHDGATTSNTTGLTGGGDDNGDDSGPVPNYYSYNISVATDVACGAYTVTVYTSYCIDNSAFLAFYYSQCSQYGNYQVWPDRWNQSITVYAPQTVNFGLPTVTTAWIPEAMAFVHNSSEGTPTVTLDDSSTYTSSFSQTDGAVSLSSSTEWSSVGTLGGVANSNIEEFANYNTTGILSVDMTQNRTPWISGIQYWGNPNAAKDSPYAVSDPEVASDFNKNTCYPKWQQNEQNGGWWNDTFEVKGSSTDLVKAGVYISAGVDFGLGIEFGLDGIGIGLGVSLNFQIVDTTLSVTTNVNTEWSFHIHYLAPNVYYSACTDALGPGSTVMLHIWES